MERVVVVVVVVVVVCVCVGGGGGMLVYPDMRICPKLCCSGMMLVVWCDVISWLQ